MRVWIGEGNEGNEGNEGRSGNATGTAFYPLTGAVLQGETSNNVEYPIIKDVSYPAARWDPLLRAQLVIGEFGESPEGRKDWRSEIRLTKWSDADEVIEAEINELVRLAKIERRPWINEILAQSGDSSGYFINMLMADRNGRPATFALIQVAFSIGQMVVMHFKHLHQRARPVQLYPGLLPPIPTPSHASWPSGHATQSWLAALCLTEACASLQRPAKELAMRIGKNRERAGLHYQSDSDAGRELAQQAFTILLRGKHFQEILTTAKREWP